MPVMTSATLGFGQSDEDRAVLLDRVEGDAAVLAGLRPFRYAAFRFQARQPDFCSRSATVLPEAAAEFVGKACRRSAGGLIVRRDATGPAGVS